MEVDRLIALGHYEEARHRILAGEEGDAQGLAVLLELRDWLRLKEYGRALKVLEQDGEQVRAYLDVEQARAAIEAFEAEDAERIGAYLSDPHLGAEAQAVLGLVHVRRGERAAARQAFEAALRADPGHYRAKTNLANLALEAGQTEEAIRLYEEALRLNPEYALAHHNLGAAYRKKGQLDKAVYHIKQGQRLQMRPPVRPLGGMAPGAGQARPGRRPWWVWFLLAGLVLWLIGRRP